MKLTASIGGAIWEIDTARGHDIAVALDFDGPQPSLYGTEAATALPWRSGDFVGDTRLGGSCNVSRVTLVPHCNGTHTECIGHISDERVFLADVLRPGLIAASLVTVRPEPAQGESSLPALDGTEPVISARLLQKEIDQTMKGFLDALVIRTSPNHPEKAYRAWQEAPFFTVEAMKLLIAHGVRHLVVDLPSLDRLSDDGKMAAHRTFWQTGEEGADGMPPEDGEAIRRTVTELVYIPDSVHDGPYLLDLQIPAFRSDAAPSRPILYPVSR